MIEANRRVSTHALTPNTIKAVLEYTALPMSGYDALTEGRGSLNAAGAIQLAQSIDPMLPVGTFWTTNSAVAPWTTIGDETLPWAQTVVWGNTVVWGDVVDVSEPGGAVTAAISTGHLSDVAPPGDGVVAHLRDSKPLVRLRESGRRSRCKRRRRDSAGSHSAGIPTRPTGRELGSVDGW